MIAADLQQLTFQKKRDYSKILEKELDYLTADLQSMTGTAALLAGFGFSGINSGPNMPGRCSTDIPDTFNPDGSVRSNSNNKPGCGLSWGDSPLENLVGFYTHNTQFEFIYCLVTLTALMLNLALLCYGTCLSMFGPNSALHVHNEAFLEQSLRSMRKDRTNCIKLLAWGMSFFVLSNMMSGWYRWRAEIGATVTLVTVIFFYLLQLMYSKLQAWYTVPALYPKHLRTFCCHRRATSGIHVFHEDYLTIRISSRNTSKWPIVYVQLLENSIRYSYKPGGHVDGEIFFRRGITFSVQVQSIYIVYL
jgi:hypothetical protein